MADPQKDPNETPRPVPGHPRTAIEESHTGSMGPSSSPNDTPGLHGSGAIHENRQGMTYRAGAATPTHLKWYVGQGGITGTASGTPFATHEPGEFRAPRQAPPVGWDPEATDDVDVQIAGGDGRREQERERKDEPR